MALIKYHFKTKFSAYPIKLAIASSLNFHLEELGLVISDYVSYNVMRGFSL